MQSEISLWAIKMLFTSLSRRFSVEYDCWRAIVRFKVDIVRRLHSWHVYYYCFSFSIVRVLSRFFSSNFILPGIFFRLILIYDRLYTWFPVRTDAPVGDGKRTLCCNYRRRVVAGAARRVEESRAAKIKQWVKKNYVSVRFGLLYFRRTPLAVRVYFRSGYWRVLILIRTYNSCTHVMRYTRA